MWRNERKPLAIKSPRIYDEKEYKTKDGIGVETKNK